MNNPNEPVVQASDSNILSQILTNLLNVRIFESVCEWMKFAKPHKSFTIESMHSSDVYKYRFDVSASSKWFTYCDRILVAVTLCHYWNWNLFHSIISASFMRKIKYFISHFNGSTVGNFITNCESFQRNTATIHASNNN